LGDELVALIAKRFIQRRDVKAVQFNSGAYVPDRELKDRQGNPDPGRFGPLGFKVQHLRDHLAGTATYGHYLLDHEDKCRLFAFDIDLEKEGSWVQLPALDGTEIADDISDEDFAKLCSTNECNPREVWLDRRQQAARNWYKYQFGMLARKMTAVIQEHLDIPCAAAYSGNKGIHVYGFTGEMPAAEVRAAANLVLEIMDEWEPKKGIHFFQHRIKDPVMGYPSISVEVFPKQDSLDGKDLGNLMRLPLGRNLKTTDPTFFLDLTSPIAQMKPHPDPIKLLETGDPYL
jgi:hypothetical protein